MRKVRTQRETFYGQFTRHSDYPMGSSKKILPTFLICGAHKAGTTALYKFLDQHPNMLMSDPKETGFFHKHYERGWEWFASHFENYDGEEAVGEASSMTMASQKASERIAERLPEVRLLFLLRNPIERAYSHYHYHLYTGKAATPAAFSEVIRNEENAFRNEIIRLGRYDRQIPRFDKHFSRDQMKIVLQEDLREETESVVRDVCRFVGVEPTFAPSTETHNATKNLLLPALYYWARRAWQPVKSIGEAVFPKRVDALRQGVRQLLTTQNRPEMDVEDRAYLRRVYEDTVSWTEQRLGRALRHWK